MESNTKSTKILILVLVGDVPWAIHETLNLSFKTVFVDWCFSACIVDAFFFFWLFLQLTMFHCTVKWVACLWYIIIVYNKRNYQQLLINFIQQNGNKYYSWSTEEKLTFFFSTTKKNRKEDWWLASTLHTYWFPFLLMIYVMWCLIVAKDNKTVCTGLEHGKTVSREEYEKITLFG